MPHPPTLAVVPVFVNAGAALFPAIIAGFTSIISLLLRPRALLDAGRRHPLWAAAALLVLAAFLVSVPRLVNFFTARPAAAAAPPPTLVDWPALAREMLRAQQGDHALLIPLWHDDLDGQMAFANICIDKDSTGRPTLYMPTALVNALNNAGSLIALDAQSGRRLWRTTAGPNGRTLYPICSTPTLAAHGARIIVGEGLHDNANCSLLCFDTRDGRLLWNLPTTQHLESSPVLFTAGGIEQVVIGAGAIEGPNGQKTGNPGYVFCASVETGKELWRCAVNDPSAPPVVDDAIYIGAGVNGNAIVALRPDPDQTLAGAPRILWKTPTDYPATGDPILATHDSLGKLLILGIGNGKYGFSAPNPAGAVLALDRTTGRILWRTPLPDGVLGRPAIHAHLVLAGCRDGLVYALDLATGRMVWHTQVSVAPAIPILSGIVSDHAYAFALAGDGTLAILNPADGRILERWTFANPSVGVLNMTMSTPAIVDGILYLATETDGLRALRIIHQTPASTPQTAP